MRQDNASFRAENALQYRQPQFVVKVEFDTNDVVYLTSHPVTGLSGDNVYEGVITDLSGTSQRLDPKKANSEIGSFDFSVLDDGLTNLQRQKLEQDKGLKGKTVEAYVGAEALTWTDFILTTTQIVESVSYKDRAYRFRCADIQRQLREDIFDPKQTALSASLGAFDTTVEVFSTSAFERYFQPNVSQADAPGEKVGYIRVESDNEFEVIRYTSTTSSTFVVDHEVTTLASATSDGDTSISLTDASSFRTSGRGTIGSGGTISEITWSGKSGNTLTGVTGVGAHAVSESVKDAKGRGVLGTRPLEVEKTGDSTADNAPKVEEYIYLEMPAAMLTYALLTGALYGIPGETLPDHWHLGISPAFVATSDYTGIGTDLWDTSDLDKGLIARFEALDKEDGKQFIEEQLFRMMGCYGPVYADGQIGLRRMTGVHSRSGFVRELNVSNVVSYGDLDHAMKDVINLMAVYWNYVPQKEDFTRTNVLQDPTSIQRHGQADLYEIEFRGLHGSRHSYETIKAILDSLRDRYAGPPLMLDLTLTPDQNDLEIGDIVRVDLEHVKDYTGETRDGHLQRNFEIQQISTNWKTGEVKVRLFGSSQKASAVPPEQYGSALTNTFYTSTGTEINDTNFPGAVTSSGGITTITGDITLAGGASMSDSGSIFYCSEDLTVDAGVTVTLSGNVQLRVAGFFQNNGEINGVGGGHAGGAGVSNLVWDGTTLEDGYVNYEWSPENFGEEGYLNAGVLPGLGVCAAVGLLYHGLVHFLGQSMASGGKFPAVPRLQLKVENDSVVGLPDDLRGSGGTGGGPVVGSFVNTLNAAGGDGGDGGAGFLAICRGASMGSNGEINLSGTDGSPGSTWRPVADGIKIEAGSGGGGGPGATIFVIDGSTANPPTLNSSNINAQIGSLQINGDIRVNAATGKGFPLYQDYSVTSDTVAGMGGVPNNSPLLPSGYELVGGGTPVFNAWEAATSVEILTGEIAPVEDVPQEADAPTVLTLQEQTNTPKSAKANLSTIECSVTAPSATNYSHSLIEYRKAGGTGWFEIGPAAPEATFVVASDGTEYEVRARAVSISGYVSATGPVETITTTNMSDGAPTTGTASTVAPLAAVTGLQVEGGGTEFGGRDCKVVWTDPNRNDLNFREYKVEVLESGTVVRTETVTDPNYTYTSEKNAEDYERENLTKGRWRAFDIRVTVVGRVETDSGLQESGSTSISVSNPAPALPGTITVSPSFRQIEVDFDQPDDLDYKELRVWLSASTGFTRDATTLVAVQAGGPIIIPGLTSGVTYYLKVATYDEFGEGTVSSEFSATTSLVQFEDVEDGLVPEPSSGQHRQVMTVNVAEDGYTLSRVEDIGALTSFGTTTDYTSDGMGSWQDTPPVVGGAVSLPFLITVEVTVETDGITDAYAELQVDESDGVTADYSIVIAYAPAGLKSGGQVKGSLTFLVPANSNYRINNASDPNGNNTLNLIRGARL